MENKGGPLQTEFNFRSLMVKEENGRYRMATAEEILEAARYELDRRVRGSDALTSPELTREFLRVRLAPQPYEIFAVVWLDNRHRVLDFEEMFRGTIDGASVHPREVVRSAMQHNAAACILAHFVPRNRMGEDAGRGVVGHGRAHDLARMHARPVDRAAE